MHAKKRKISAFYSAAFALCLQALCSRASAGGGTWTGSLIGKEGSFAFRADPENRRLYLFRADAREAFSAKLRVVLAGEQGREVVVPLQALDSIGPPWKFAAQVAEGEVDFVSARLEISSYSPAWHVVGIFHRP